MGWERHDLLEEVIALLDQMIQMEYKNCKVYGQTLGDFRSTGDKILVPQKLDNLFHL